MLLSNRHLAIKKFQNESMVANARSRTDPAFDFGVNEHDIGLLADIDKQGPTQRANLEQRVALLLARFGAHSRNTVRGILRAAQRQPVTPVTAP